MRNDVLCWNAKWISGKRCTFHDFGSFSSWSGRKLFSTPSNIYIYIYTHTHTHMRVGNACIWIHVSYVNLRINIVIFFHKLHASVSIHNDMPLSTYHHVLLFRSRVTTDKTSRYQKVPISRRCQEREREKARREWTKDRETDALDTKWKISFQDKQQHSFLQTFFF